MGRATLAGQQVQIDELSSENKAYADKVSHLEAELASLKEENDAVQATSPDRLPKLEWRKLNANVSQVVLVNYVQQVTDGSGNICLLYTSPSPRDRTRSRMPSSA